MSSADKQGASSAKGLLERHGLRPKRSLGQNFLADQSLCAKIAGLAKGSVLEIGAGLGALTAPLLAAGHRVVAVETDAPLAEALRERFSEEIATGQLSLLHADARELDFAEQLRLLPRPRTLAGNLPYHLSGLLLRRAVDASAELDFGVFLLQLEVVDRLCATHTSGQYGALSVFAQAVYKPRREFVVRRGAFYPQPNVDSAVVSLLPLDPPAAELSAPFSALVKAAFGQRRKTLRNAWRGILDSTPEALQAAAESVQIDLGARGETLSVQQFAAMSRALGGG